MYYVYIYIYIQSKNIEIACWSILIHKNRRTPVIQSSAVCPAVIPCGQLRCSSNRYLSVINMSINGELVCVGGGGPFHSFSMDRPEYKTRSSSAVLWTRDSKRTTSPSPFQPVRNLAPDFQFLSIQRSRWQKSDTCAVIGHITSFFYIYIYTHTRKPLAHKEEEKTSCAAGR